MKKNVSNWMWVSSFQFAVEGGWGNKQNWNSKIVSLSRLLGLLYAMAGSDAAFECLLESAEHLIERGYYSEGVYALRSIQNSR